MTRMLTLPNGFNMTLENGFYLVLLILISSACQTTSTESPTAPAPFRMRDGASVGLDFSNTLTQTSEFNVFNYMYFFNGGGVATGDFNQDGRPDLYFTSNMEDNRLFLNEGDWSFRDVTEAAGVAGTGGWKTGASIVDINQDGLLDIYVSQMGDYQTVSGKNQLFICQGIEDGIPVFADKAAEYGLDLVVFGTHSTFFDYDLDGDLDLYLLNHSLHANGTFGKRRVFDDTHPMAGDRLLRNDNGTFVDVTTEAGMFSTVIGYGLGVVTGDVNLDGWPDIYVGNDFHENDYLYLNQQDGTFKEVLTEQIRHTSRFSMGVDMADLNNDGYNEILSLDMLPADPYILKSSLAEDSYSIFNFKLGYGYNHQYSRNNLQLNNGDSTYSEIGIYANVFATDWSWAPLFLDYDHDGYKDLFVSNGIPRRMNDIDYVNYRADNEIRWKQQTNNLEEDDLVVVEKMPRIKLRNKFFRNQGNLQFADQSEAVLGAQPTFSNGAVAADFDGDGDLDIVTNNIEDAPSVYENLLMQNKLERPTDYLSLHLQGPQGNLQGIGARVVLYRSGEQLLHEYFPVRGYQSSTLTPFHVPVGDAGAIDSMFLVWPDNTMQRLRLAQFNAPDTVRWQEGLPAFRWSGFGKQAPTPYQFTDQTAASGLQYTHEENDFVEFNREGLIPFMVSAEGPGIAVGDLNGDGLDDVFLGSAKRVPSRIFFQTANGAFRDGTPAVLRQDSVFEDVDAAIADLNQDGRPDIVVASGGNEYWAKQDPRRQRIYWHQADGSFAMDTTVFGETFLTAACVEVADINGDNLPDLFFGGRAVPWNYGETPTSYLFINEGNGVFTEAAAKIAPGLQEVGLIRDASFTDLNQDGRPDLLLAMDWGPVIAFMNQGNRLRKKVLWEEHGWWNVTRAADVDQDGDMDILVGGIGGNAKLKPTPEEPVRMYVNDFDENDQVEQILTYYLEGKEYPFATYRELTKQMPDLKKEFLFAKDLAAAELTDIFAPQKLRQATVRHVEEAQHLLLENQGDGTFVKKHLPQRLQFSTINDFWPVDLNQDGRMEWITGGNFHRNNIEMGRYDASYGNVLEFSESGDMTVYPLGDLRLDGVVQNIRTVMVNGKPMILFVRNDGPVLIAAAESRRQLLK